MSKNKLLTSAQGVILNTPEQKKGTEGKYRDWALTIYSGEPPTFHADTTKYLVYGDEICPTTGRQHWQTYVVFNYQKTFSAVKKLYKGAHLEPCKGSPEANMRYCKKEGKWKEFGKAPAQGERGDLIEVKEDILNGKLTCEDIIIENPMLYHQYGRTLDKVEDIALRRKFRKKMTEGIWYWGRTAVGKSHEAYKDFTPETHYNYPNDKGWWDGYRQQETVILNDFRGDMPYNELLQLIDKWPHNVRRRCREPMPFTSKRIIITSSLPPEEVYHNRAEKDNIDQLLRRIKVIELKKKK